MHLPARVRIAAPILLSTTWLPLKPHFSHITIVMLTYCLSEDTLKWPQQRARRVRLPPKVGRLVHSNLPPIDSYFHFAATKTAASKDAKAKSAKKAAHRDVHGHHSRKVRHTVYFHRPKTLRLPRDPKYQRKSVHHAPRMDEFRTIVSCVFPSSLPAIPPSLCADLGLGNGVILGL